MKNKSRSLKAVLPILSVAVVLAAAAFLYISGIQRSLWNQAVAEILEVTAQGGHTFEIYVEKDMQILSRIVRHLSRLSAQDEDQIIRNIESFEDEDVRFTVIVPDRAVMYAGRGWGTRYIGTEEQALYQSFDETGLREPYLDPYTGTRMVGGCLRFRFADGSAGIVQIDRNTTVVEDEFMLSFYDGAGLSYVANRSGDILLRPPDERGSEGFPNLLDAIDGGSGADAHWLRGSMARGEQGATRFHMQGKSYVMAFIPLAGTDGWYLVSIIPNSVVMHQAGRILMSTQAFIVMLAVILTGAWVFILKDRRSGRKLREKEGTIRQREKLFDILAVNTNDVFLMFSTSDYTMEYVSPNVERLLGITCEEAKADLHLLARPDRTAIQNLKAGGSLVTEGERVHRRTGETRWFLETIYRTSVGDSERFVAVLSDRTQERRSEEALKDALSITKAANESKSIFLSNMSHDIRTPMNAIVGFSALLQRDADNPEKVLEYTRKISASSQHLLGLINDVLDMSKIESGKTTLNISEIILPEMLEELSAMIQPQARARGQEFHISVHDVVDEEVLGDRLRIDQILINILSNAVKYTPEGGKIEMTVRQVPRHAQYCAHFRFVIRDNGLGMDPEYLETIFHPFSRESTDRTAGIQGTGLGMAITKNLVDLMGGTIQVDSAPGHGSTFTLDLELRVKEQKTDPQFWKNHHVTNMLVADDEEAISTGIRTVMADTGVNISAAPGGLEAVRMAREAHEAGRDFDLFLIDWQMPDISGIETVRRIRQIVPPQVPVMILTSYDISRIEEAGTAAGVSCFLQKPFFLSNFKMVLSSLDQEPDGTAAPPDNLDTILSGRHILVAEDNELNSEILQELLGMVGATCDLTPNGQEVLEQFRNSSPGRYDMILMDVQMPIMNGYEATRAIRACGHQEARTIPIIAMTANAFAEDIREALEAGMDGHVAKPVDMDRLKQTVKTVLDRGTADH